MFEADQRAVAEADGSIRLIGDRGVVENYVTRFPLPAKLTADVGR